MFFQCLRSKLPSSQLFPFKNGGLAFTTEVASAIATKEWSFCYTAQKANEHSWSTSRCCDGVNNAEIQWVVTIWSNGHKWPWIINASFLLIILIYWYNCDCVASRKNHQVTFEAPIALMWKKVSMLWNLEVGASVIVAIAVIIVAIAVICCWAWIEKIWDGCCFPGISLQNHQL